MDLKTTLPYDEEYEASLTLEQNILDIGRLAIDLYKTTPPKFDSEEKQLQCQDNVKKLVKYCKDTTASLEQKWNTFNESKSLKTHRLDELYIPKEIKEHCQQFKIQDAITILGRIGDEKAHTMRAFLDAMFQYGENLNLSWEDYKAILSACFEGTLKQQFLIQKKDSLKDIVTWFDTVYHRPDEFHTLDKQLKKFCRYANEPVHIFLKRYDLLARRADSLLPSDQKFFTTNLHKQNLIELALQEPARTDYKKWKNRYFDGGFSISIEECTRQAGILEKYHNCIPTVKVPLYKDSSTAYANLNTTAEVHIATRAFQKTNPSSLLPHTELDKVIKRTKKPAPRTVIDPHRSSTQAPSYFNNRDAHSQNVNKRNLVKQPTVPFSTRPKFQPNRSLPSTTFRGRTLGKGSFQTPISKRLPYPRNIFSPPTPRPTGRSPFMPNKQTSIPSRFVKAPNSGGYPRIPPLVKPGAQNPAFFCLRCGIRKGGNRTAITSDHITRNCHFYPPCNTLCPFCLQVKGIEAYHEVNRCLSWKRQRSFRPQTPKQ